MRKPLLAIALAFTACQSTEPQGAMVASTPAPAAPIATPPPIPSDPAVLALIGIVPDLPTGFTPSGRELDAKREGKYTLVLDGDGAFASQRMSYTLYPDAAQAKAAFVRIGDTPPDRNVVSRESFAPVGLEGEVWAETTHEDYGGTPFHRTATAVVVERAVVLAQVVARGEPSPIATTAAVALLQSAVGHMRAAFAATAAAGAPGATSPAATTGAAPTGAAPTGAAPTPEAPLPAPGT